MNLPDYLLLTVFPLSFPPEESAGRIPPGATAN